jgi:hypothetical protein
MPILNTDNAGRSERDFMKVLESEHTTGTEFSQEILDQFYDLYDEDRMNNHDERWDPTSDEVMRRVCIEYKHSLYFQYYIVNSELKTSTENQTKTSEYKNQIIELLDNITQFQESIYCLIEWKWSQNNPRLHSIYNGVVTTPLPETDIELFQVIRFLVEYGYHWGWREQNYGVKVYRDKYPIYASHNDNHDYRNMRDEVEDLDLESELSGRIYDKCFCPPTSPPDIYDSAKNVRLYAMTVYKDWFSADTPTIFRKNHSLIGVIKFIKKNNKYVGIE